MPRAFVLVSALALLLVLFLLLTRTPQHAGQADAPPATPANAALPDEEARALLDTLLNGDESEVTVAIETILAAGDQRFAAPFIELFRATGIGVVRNSGYRAYAAALERLTGEEFGEAWGSWLTWYGASTLGPPPGFTRWKGELFARIDPDFAGFFQDEPPPRVRVEEVQWGGVMVDGIPALDNPAMLPASEADYLLPEDAVFGIAINGDARAYPLRIMDWHEMANDVVGGVPLSLAYCTLCGAAIAFDGRVSEERYTFGSSGLLFRSNKLMYDRQTRTLWNHFTGEPVMGKLAGSGQRLSLLPVVLTTWEAWQAEHPTTRVLDINTGHGRDYRAGAAYGGYFAAPDTMFPIWQQSDALPAKSQVYGLMLGGTRKAYPIERLAAAGVVNDSVGETGVVLVASRGIVTVRGTDRGAGGVAYSAGSEVRAFRRGERTFQLGDSADLLLDEAGREWRVTEEALLGPDGERAPRLNGHLAYWFGWYAFFPDTLVYQNEP